MRTNNYVLVNGQAYLEDATLADVRDLAKRLNLKLVLSYTFQMRTKLRRVLRFEAQGVVYSVYGPKRYIDSYSYTQEPLYFGFDRDRAYSFDSETHEFEARSVNFSQPHLKRLFAEVSK